MKCPIKTQENADVLLAYSARKLDPEITAVLAKHMEMCTECAAFHKGQQAVWAALDAWEALPVSEDFDQRLYFRIDRERHASWWSKVAQVFLPSRLSFFGRTSQAGMPLPLLATVCIIVVAGFVLEYPGRVNPLDPAPQARIDKIEADQVERTLEDLEMLREFNLVSSAEGKPSASM